MILGFLLTALYWPGIAGAATTPRWGLLAVVLPCLLWGKGKFTLAHMFGVAFIGWACLSLLWTPNQLDGVGDLIKLMILAQVFVYGSRLDNLQPILTGMAIGLILSSVTVLVQLWWPDVVIRTTMNSGLFINSGTLGEIAALLVIASIGYRQWWLIIGMLPALMLPMSRGALLALLAAFVVFAFRKGRLAGVLVTMLVIGAGTALLLSGFHWSSVAERLGIWNDTLRGLTLLGHGLGSFWTDYAPLSESLDIFIQRPDHAHNDFLEYVFELGLPGAFLIGAIIWCATKARGIELYILAGLAAEASVGFPLHMPCTSFLAALCLGHLARDGHSLRYLFHARRIRFQAWFIRNRRSADDRGVSIRGAILPVRSTV